MWLNGNILQVLVQTSLAKGDLVEHPPLRALKSKAGAWDPWHSMDIHGQWWDIFTLCIPV